MRLVVAALALALALAAPAAANPALTRAARAKLGGTTSIAHALPVVRHAPQITVGELGELRPAREVGRGLALPITPEDETAAQLATLLRGSLRVGTTSLYVADAKTGEPLFAINADDAVNPASNVKMISTATALELLGPEYRYPTRLLGPAPEDGVVRGDVFLLGSYDPTLTVDDLDDIVTSLVMRGVTAIHGNIVVGTDPTRDGIYQAVIPIEITAGEPGRAPIATTPLGADHVSFTITAKTVARVQRPRLSFAVATTTEAGRPHLTVTIAGTIGKGGITRYPLVTRERTATAVYALRAALRARGIEVTGDLQLAELGDFVGDAVGAGALPVELGRHESEPLAAIVQRVNKWSINWLADRVIVTAAALARHHAPSMDLALDAMYGWLGRHANVGKDQVFLDSGSGLSYRTQITTHDLVSVVRSAAGFTHEPDAAPDAAIAGHAWLDSLSIAGTDGTLRRRFRLSTARGHVHGKTGTLSTVIALSGVLDIDPERPLAFSLVTNTHTPLAKRNVRKAHERVVAALCAYAEKTAKTPSLAPNLFEPPSFESPASEPRLDETGEAATGEDIEEAEPEAEPAAESWSTATPAP